MKISAAIREYLIEIEVRKYTPKTIRGYRNSLNLFLRFCEQETHIQEVEEINLAVVRQFSAFMSQKGRKGSYINGLLKVSKSFIQYCYDEGYGGFDTKKNFKWCKQDKAVIVAFKPCNVKQLLQESKGTDCIHVRDTAILTALCVVPITPVLQKALIKYNACAADYFTLRGTDDFYFLSNHGRQLTNSAVENIIKRYGQGIVGVRVSPHTCRHFYAKQQVKMGTDLYTISRLLGHENIQITQTYLNSLRDEDIINNTKQRSVLMSI